MEIAEIQKVIRVTKQNPGLSEDDITEKILKISDPSIRPGLYRILIKACDVHNQTLDNVLKDCREANYVRVRQQYCLVAWLFGYTFKETGRAIKKDHATALSGKNKALTFYTTETDYRMEIDALMDKFPEHTEMLHKKIDELTDIQTNGEN